ncbi:MAG: hypothetical protein JNG89_02935 [Planctomycetaceae bacterium]|nr:hypothetical protein [Planctomycetaceae bacterium]
MVGRLDGMAVLSRLCPLSHPNLRFVANADTSLIAEVNRGVLLLMAFWSGSSVTSYRRLMQTLQTPAGRNIEVVVVDHDGAHPLYVIPEFSGRLGGNGETAWIRGGIIGATTTGTTGPESFAQCLDSLLSAP